MKTAQHPPKQEVASEQPIRVPQKPVLTFHWFYAFFFISGFCSLVYEVVWLRLSMAKFGVTTPMVSIFLSVFMAGLGIGSWGGGLFIRRFRSGRIALRLYGLVELVIGISGFLAPLLMNAGYHLLQNAGRGLSWGSSLYYLMSGAWITVSLLPWCTCMGATFPFAMAAIRSMRAEESQLSFSYLYLANVLGAIAGTLIPAFVLIELFGFKQTLHIASALNAILAAGVFLLSFAVTTFDARQRQVSQPVRENLAPKPEVRVLSLLFTTGLCSMAMEVVWIRQFTVYLGNLVYAFAVILALYLVATFAGSSLYRKWIHSHGPDDIEPAWIVLGLASLLPLLFADPRLPIPRVITIASLGYGAIRASLAIMPFSCLVGFLTPMLVDFWSGGNPERAGRAYAINVLGSILGPLVAGFCVLPWAGERWALCVLALPLFAIGFRSARRTSHWGGTFLKLRPGSLYAGAVAASVLLAVLTENYGTKFPQRIELRDHTATVIATGQGMRKQLLVNGTGMTKLTPITKMMAHLPLAFLNRPPKNGLVICLGMGTTFRSMASWGINVTAVELVPSVAKVFGYFHPDGPALLKTGEARIVIDDGRRFLERSPDQYDVIAIDPPPPISAPTSSLLYSQEFLAILKPHLRPGGILQLWCPGGDNATMSAITKSIRQAFPYVRAFGSIEGWGDHYLASMVPIPDVTPEILAQKLPVHASEDLVEWNRNLTPAKMFGSVLDGEDELDDFISPDPSVPPIQDDRPINEYFLLRWADPRLPI